MCRENRRLPGWPFDSPGPNISVAGGFDVQSIQVPGQAKNSCQLCGRIPQAAAQDAGDIGENRIIGFQIFLQDSGEFQPVQRPYPDLGNCHDTG